MTAGPFYRELAGASAGDLERVMRASPAPELRDLVGYQWRGYNTPAGSVLLGIRKFIKVFITAGDRTEGYNLRALGTRLDEPWRPRGRDAMASRIGLYGVLPAFTHGPSPYAHAVLIDYGAYPAQRWFIRSIRDYLVRPDPAHPDVLCGKAYFVFGRVRVPAGYFILERHTPV